MEHYQNKYIPILIDEIFEPVLKIEKVREDVKAEVDPQSSTSEEKILKSISNVENNFLEDFVYRESNYDFGITKILKGEIFDITATSTTNNTLGILKSEHFEYKTTLEDISGELN